MTKPFSFLAFLSALLLFVASCTPDPCEDVSCPSDASCEEGVCICTGGAIYDPTDNTCDCAVGFVRDATGDCVVDPCTNITCNNGTCDNGNCDCDDGYEQDSNGSCTVETRSRYVGSYVLGESCDGMNSAYVCTVANSTTAVSHVTITNLFNENRTTTATVENNTLTIPEQAFNNGTIQGSGMLSNDTLAINYTVIVPGFGTSTCSGNMVKQ